MRKDLRDRVLAVTAQLEKLAEPDMDREQAIQQTAEAGAVAIMEKLEELLQVPASMKIKQDLVNKIKEFLSSV